MRSPWWCSALAALLLAACGGGAGAGPYDYDRGAPLAFRDGGVVSHGLRVKIHDVSYAGEGHRVKAYLMLPPADRGRRFPAVVFLHGSGGTRDDFAVFAASLALAGAVTMTLTVPPSTEYRPMVVDVRRVLDLLDGRPDVDPKRIGVVGYSLGGQLAAIVAGADDRPKAVGVIAGRGTPEAEDAVAEARADLFFQAGVNDTLVGPDRLEALIDAAPESHRRVRWYPTGHEMSSAAFDEQNAWQARELGIRLPR